MQGTERIVDLRVDRRDGYNGVGRGGGPPPPRRRNDDDEIRPANFGQFSLLLTLEKTVIFGPHHIHLCVQHIPLINLMGLMTFMQKFFVETLDHFAP